MIIVRSLARIGELDIVFWANFSGRNHILSHAHYAIKFEGVTLCGRELKAPNITRYSASTRMIIKGQEECSRCLRKVVSGQF